MDRLLQLPDLMDETKRLTVEWSIAVQETEAEIALTVHAVDVAIASDPTLKNVESRRIERQTKLNKSSKYQAQIKTLAKQRERLEYVKCDHESALNEFRALCIYVEARKEDEKRKSEVRRVGVRPKARKSFYRDSS